MDNEKNDFQSSELSFQMDLLMEMVGECKKMSPTLDSNIVGPVSFEEIDKMLALILGGNITRADAERFLSAIRNSKETFEKVLLKLKHLEPIAEKETEKVISGIVLQNEKILKFLNEKYQPSKIKKREWSIANRLSSFVFSVKETLFSLKPVPAFAGAIVVLLAVITGTLYNTGGIDDPVYNSYFDSVEPYYHASELYRGNDTEIVNKEEIPYTFNLKIAMGEYLTGDYDKALELLQNLQDSMATSNRISVEKNKELFAETSFCRGMVYLGFAQQKNRWHYKKQLVLARNHFLKARSYSSAGFEKNLQRILFFEGLTLFLLDDYKNARELLEKAKESEEFKTRSQQLLSAIEAKI